MKTIEKREITYCDRCKGEVESQNTCLMKKCPVCKRTVCSWCGDRLFERYDVGLCKDCADIPEVAARKKKFYGWYYSRLDKEKEELSKLKVAKKKLVKA